MSLYVFVCNLYVCLCKLHGKWILAHFLIYFLVYVIKRLWQWFFHHLCIFDITCEHVVKYTEVSITFVEFELPRYRTASLYQCRRWANSLLHFYVVFYLVWSHQVLNDVTQS